MQYLIPLEHEIVKYALRYKTASNFLFHFRIPFSDNLGQNTWDAHSLFEEIKHVSNTWSLKYSPHPPPRPVSMLDMILFCITLYFFWINGSLSELYPNIEWGGGWGGAGEGRGWVAVWRGKKWWKIYKNHALKITHHKTFTWRTITH